MSKASRQFVIISAGLAIAIIFTFSKTSSPTVILTPRTPQNLPEKEIAQTPAAVITDKFVSPALLDAAPSPPTTVSTNTATGKTEAPESPLAPTSEPPIKIPEPDLKVPATQTPVVSAEPIEPLVKTFSAPAISLNALTEQVRASVVNVFCTSARGGSFQPISGSGVFIDPRGIVLTNAHVAQYLLLEGDPAYGTLDCVLRTGNPAVRKYDAALLYLPSTWVVANASNITKDRSAGTGEHDYALLLVTKALRTGEKLPETFPFVEPDAYYDDLPLQRAVLLAGYPAGFLDGISIQRNLGLVSSIATIQRRLTFDEPPSPNLDVISLGGNIIAQEGASGSAVVDTADGTLVGIVVTSTLASTTQARNLNAITIPHINRSVIAHTEKPLLEFLSEDPATLVARFREDIFPKLKSLLVAELER